MTFRIQRRATLFGAIALLAATALPSLAQDKPVLRF